ncbi:ATP/GTP-binding protein [Lacibacter luteus]|uniref:ATP/GTP-binding protein n=1 Tax=Lacibacter luteus TaxID=2508719 RepID=A0A4Q1CET7_9BACT|nr:ATP/GTP-binding protein [Lacibacter luteus]RXK58386.1 ATP/GTP-binding protein [Lacibacter luteus]
MKKLASVLLFTSILFTATAQHQLVKLWETDTTLKVPESVYFDGKNKVLYITNIDGKEPWGKDGKGSVGKVGLDGKIISAEWITGLNAPKGMGLHKNKLYVADLTELVVIDINKGTISERIAIEGSAGLNDVSTEENGTVYVTDSKARRVYEVKEGKASILLDSSKLKGPNGVLKHKGNLYVLDAGTMYRMEKDGSLSKLAEGMEGGTDGIENITGGDFLVSTWGGVVYYVNADGTKQVLLDGREQKINSADIGYDAAKRIVYVPTFWRNTVVAYELK